MRGLGRHFETRAWPALRLGPRPDFPPVLPACAQQCREFRAARSPMWMLSSARASGPSGRTPAIRVYLFAELRQDLHHAMSQPAMRSAFRSSLVGRPSLFVQSWCRNAHAPCADGGGVRIAAFLIAPTEQSARGVPPGGSRRDCKPPLDAQPELRSTSAACQETPATCQAITLHPVALRRPPPPAPRPSRAAHGARLPPRKCLSSGSSGARATQKKRSGRRRARGRLDTDAPPHG
jgi:hypothetical protein